MTLLNRTFPDVFPFGSGFLIKSGTNWERISKRALSRRLKAAGFSSRLCADCSELDRTLLECEQHPRVNAVVCVPERPCGLIEEPGRRLLNIGAGETNPFKGGSPTPRELCQYWLSLVVPSRRIRGLSSYALKHLAERFGGIYRGHIPESIFIEEAERAGFSSQSAPGKSRYFNISKRSAIRASAPKLTAGGCI